MCTEIHKTNEPVVREYQTNAHEGLIYPWDVYITIQLYKSNKIDIIAWVLYENAVKQYFAN